MSDDGAATDAGGSEPQAPIAPLPPPPRTKAGGLIRAILLCGVSLGVVLGWLHTQRIERWSAALASMPWDSYHRDDLRAWLDAEDDPRIDGIFAREAAIFAAGLNEPEAYDGEMEYRIDRAEWMWKDLVPYLLRRKPEPTDDYLGAILLVYAKLEADECLELVAQMGDGVHDRLRENVATIEDPRAKYGALLLLCAAGAGRPEDAAAILAGAEADDPPPTEDDLVAAAISQENASPIANEFDPTTRHAAAKTALLGFGDAIVPQLIEGMQSRSRAVANLCSSVLKEVDLQTLIEQMEKRIDEYAAFGLNRPWAHKVLEIHDFFEKNPQALAEIEEGPENPVPSAKDVEDARTVIGSDYHLSNLIAEGLQQLTDVRNDERVDLCFMRALSSPNEPVAKFCARELRDRLDRPKFADTIFKFLTHKNRFAVREVEVYEDALESYGPTISGDIVRNLETLLERASGSARDVFWIHKVIALRCLIEVGQPDAYDALVKFADDPYMFEASSMNALGQKESEVVFYNDLCRQAAAAISSRTGRPAPTIPPRPALPDDEEGN